MRLNQLTSFALNQLIGWLLWRILAFAAVGLFALIALYQFAVAGTIALELQVGGLYAHLIVAGVFCVAALIIIGTIVATRPRLKNPAEGVLNEPRKAQIATLVEAVVLGYALARKKPRS
ncbi:MAG: hypothetical protein ACR2K5_10325 [Pseudolabrys sp.]